MHVDELLSTLGPPPDAKLSLETFTSVLGAVYRGFGAHELHVRDSRKTCMKLHFTLLVPHAVGLHELVTACKELFGWDMQRTMQLLQGLSTTSAAATRELAEVARLVRNRAAARARL